MCDDFLAANDLGLVHLDWVERSRIGGCAIIHVEPPKSADQANGPAGAVELESILRWLCNMDFAGRRGESAPPKVVPCAERSELWEITGRFLAYRRLPVGGGCNRKSMEDAKQDYGGA